MLESRNSGHHHGAFSNGFINTTFVMESLCSLLRVPLFFYKCVAFVFQKPNIRFLASIERHTDCPGTIINLGIIDRCFVKHVVRTGEGIAFGNTKLIAVIITRAIQPGLIGEVNNIDYEGIAFPVPS